MKNKSQVQIRSTEDARLGLGTTLTAGLPSESRATARSQSIQQQRFHL